MSPSLALYVRSYLFHTVLISVFSDDVCPIKYYDVSCATFLKQVQSASNATDNETSLISDARFTRFHSLSSENCYVLVHKNMTYQEANQVCTNANGHLAWVDNPYEATDLWKNANTDLNQHMAKVWVGMTRKTNDKSYNNSMNETVWDCGGPSYTSRDVVIDDSEVCFSDSDQLVKNGSASLCADLVHVNGTCYCWEAQAVTTHPFYCQIKSVCTLKPIDTCEEFLKNMGGNDLLLPPSHITLNTCYILVNDSMTWQAAMNICSSAGGRLPWPNIYAQELISFANDCGAGNRTWIGLRQWDINNSDWFVHQRQCPTEGQNIKSDGFYHKPGFTNLGNITPGAWWADDPNALDPSDDALQSGYMKFDTNGQFEYDFASTNNLSLPFFCERPKVPTTTTLVDFPTSSTTRTVSSSPAGPPTTSVVSINSAGPSKVHPDLKSTTEYGGSPGDGAEASTTTEGSDVIMILIGLAGLAFIIVILVVCYVMRPQRRKDFDDLEGSTTGKDGTNDDTGRSSAMDRNSYEGSFL